MWRQIKTHINILFSKKPARLMFIFILMLVAINYFSNIITYHGYDVHRMFNSMKILSLSDYVAVSFYFMQMLPFVIAVPAAFSYLSDMHSREIVFIESRCSKREYYISKAAAVFIVTFIVFTVPFFLEIILNLIAFPVSVGDPSNMNIFDTVYNSLISGYLFSELWIFNGYLYVIFYICLLGIFTGTLAVFAMAVSVCLRFKFKIFVFIPVYVLLYAVNAVGKMLKPSFDTNYFFYFRMFDTTAKSGTALILFITAVVVASVAILFIKIPKDELG